MTFYKELYTRPTFHHFLRKFWVLDNLANSLSSVPKFALPNGCFTLAFISGTGICINTPQASFSVKEGIYLFGQLNSRVSLRLEPYSKVIMVQLQPWAASVFTNLPLHEITNLSVCFKEVNKTLFQDFQGVELFNEKAVLAQFYKTFQPYLSQLAKPSMLEYLCCGMQANSHNDAFRIAALSSQINYSTRFIQKKFKNQIGLTPKEFYLISRMRNLLKELNAPTNSQSLTELALNFGFYDQSHFIKSFSGILLISPKNYSPKNYILPLAEFNEARSLFYNFAG